MLNLFFFIFAYRKWQKKNLYSKDNLYIRQNHCPLLTGGGFFFPFPGKNGEFEPAIYSCFLKLNFRFATSFFPPFFK